jgi:hypothetical protein
MSDIYLQITETPTVVTLSAPVISGALSSTVTVANTVTVALDANSLSALENVTVTVGAAITGTVTVSNFPASQAVTFSSVSISNLPATQAVSLVSVPTHGVTLTSTTVTVSSLPALAAGTAQIGSVTASISGWLSSVIAGAELNIGGSPIQATNPVPARIFIGTGSGAAVSAGNPMPISGTVTIGAGTAQIGSVTASISGTVPVSISSVTVGNSVTIGNFPATQAVTFGQAIVSASNITGLNNSVGTDGNTPTSTNFIKIGGHQDGSNQVEHIVHVSAGGAMKVDASDSTVTFGVIRGTVTVGNSVTIGSLPAISGTVTANTFALQGTVVTTSNFTSTTASTVLANYNATREVLTIFNEGAGNLHICAGATCTTIAYQVRLSAGDYYEVPNHQTTITHSAVFATAGTARVTEVS